MPRAFTMAIKGADELHDFELAELDQASYREFGVHLPQRRELQGRTLFLLEERRRILAMGQLLPIEPIRLEDQDYSILGINGVIANVKEQGYGKIVMASIKKYLKRSGKTGLGFCKLRNRIFYEKCGFQTNVAILDRLIYPPTGFKASDENECMFFCENDNDLIHRMSEKPSLVMELPTPPTW